jgi:hypothetical protein
MPWGAKSLLTVSAESDGNPLNYSLIYKYEFVLWPHRISKLVVLLCQFWFWREIGFGCTYCYVLGVPYSCGVVLVFLVLAGNSFWCYVRT